MGLLGTIISITLTNAIVFALNEWFLMKQFRVEFDDQEEAKLFNFGQIKAIFWSFWKWSWPSVLLNLLKTGTLLCLFVRSGEITIKEMLPVIGIQIFLNDVFLQLSKGFEQSLCSFIGFYIGSEQTPKQAQKHSKLFQQ